MKVLTKLQILDKVKEKNKTFQVIIIEYLCEVTGLLCCNENTIKFERDLEI